MKNKRVLYIILGVIVAAGILYFLFGPSKSNKVVDQKVKTQKGLFEIVIATTGELQASSQQRIEAPSELRGRSIRLSEIKILDMVAEGTVVDSGDYVASLDRSSASNTLKSAQDELEQLKASYESTLLDTSLNLRGIRDNIVNLKFSLEEKKIAVEQSIYEPPATQRSAQNALDKAQRDYEQEVKNYDLKLSQNEAKVRDVRIKLSRKEQEYEDMQNVLNKFTITAPKPGMVIYFREWSGEKRKVGSSISPWDPIIATLPDMSTMVSKTYVNEIDISKIKKGQQVRVGVDAFPEKKYTGIVTDVANIGEQLKNADAKVFEVIVKINETDPILRPSMTTSNQIVTATIEDAVYIPLEALHGGEDSVTYVYRTNNTKQIVVTGEMNDNFRIIEQGLKEGDEIYLSVPERAEKFKTVGEDLIPIIRQRIEEKRKEEEERQKEAEEAEKQRQSFRGGRGGGMGGMMPGGMSGGAVSVNRNGGGNGGAIQTAAGGDGQRQGGGGRGGERPQINMDNVPQEIKDAMAKGDTAAIRKYVREQRAKTPKDSTANKPANQATQQKPQGQPATPPQGTTTIKVQ